MTDRLHFSPPNRGEEKFYKINKPNILEKKISKEELLIESLPKIIKQNLKSRDFNNSIDKEIIEVVFNSSRNDSEFNRLLEQIRNGQIRTPQEGTTTSFYSRYGLMAHLGIVLEQIGVVVGGQRVLRFGDSYTSVDFIPDGRTQKVNSKVTDSIEKCIKGMTELVVAVDRGEVRVAPFLMGRTNINMVLFAQRLGFKVEDADRKPDGTIDTEKGSFTVVAKLEDVRQKLAEFAASGVTEKISQRAARLRPQTA